MPFSLGIAGGAFSLIIDQRSGFVEGREWGIYFLSFQPRVELRPLPFITPIFIVEILLPLLLDQFLP
jgi:hypothetical protein